MSARTATRAKAAPRRLAPEIVAERSHLMKALHPVVQMLGTIVGHHIEVVLHDLTRPESSIVAIANGHVSNRRVGNSILSGPKDDKAFVAAREALTGAGEAVHSIVDDYPTLTRSGQRLKSSTVIFRDAGGEPFAALCLNADHTIPEAAHAWLGRLLKADGAPPPARDEEPEMDTLMKEIISDAVRRLGKPVSVMNKEEKIQAVQAMMQRGLFIVKGGVERAASALGVSRFTIYNYQEALRGRVVEADTATLRAAASAAPRGKPKR
jgi:predicted transcriptional regulator YheO